MTTALSISPLTSTDALVDIDVLWHRIVAQVRKEYLSEKQSYPWIVAFSGGKDSTILAAAVFEALISIPPSERTRKIHIVSNDTLVESPLVVAHLKHSQNAIQFAASKWNLPITVATTIPKPDQTFWTLLIGKGYPSPNSQFRWCTDRLKIYPSSQYILDMVACDGAAIVLLGVRSSESSARKISIEKHRNEQGSNLAPHTSLKGAFVYRPIIHMTTDEVWEVIGTFAPPWGGSHSSLIKLYRDAEGGECPFVLSKDEAPGCGTASSRFGCWTCTVVEKDRSLQGFVDAGRHEYEPLIAFRDWIKEIRNDPKFRSTKRRNGKVEFNSCTGKHIPGPFTLQARKMMLTKILETQDEYKNELISQQEIAQIWSIWAEELSQLKEATI